MQQIPASQLKPGDSFIPDRIIADWREEGASWLWRVKSHELTKRGDYSTMIECNGTDWSERFDPDELVWRI